MQKREHEWNERSCILTGQKRTPSRVHVLNTLFLPVQMIEELLGRADACEWDCKGELTAHSDTDSGEIAEELLQHANCGGRKVSSRWEDGQAPVLVSGAGHDSLPMSEITKVRLNVWHRYGPMHGKTSGIASIYVLYGRKQT